MKILSFLILSTFLIFKTESVFTEQVTLLSTKPNDVNNYWNDFKLTFNRKYNRTFDAFKRKVFERNIRKINQLNEQFNNGAITYVSGFNQFSDMSSDEFLDYVNKGLLNLTSTPIIINDDDNKFKSSLKALPLSVDWRQNGYVNPIQSQGSCGSCWAFSSAAAIEGQFFKANNKLIKISEQNLVDCVYGRDGCRGGLMDDAFEYVINNKGVSTEASYKYTSGTTNTWSGRCNYNSTTRGAQVNSYIFVSNGNPDENAITRALAEVGPLSAALLVTQNFQFYKSGIFDNDPLCANIPLSYINHAIALVGYGTENGQDYYILRNSWGTNWGEEGYMRIMRNKNLCNIGVFVVYPRVQSSRPTTSTNAPSSTRRTTTTTSRTTSRNSIPTYVDLSSRNIKKIDSSLFANYEVSSIEILSLNYNNIRVIEKNAFSKFQNLKELSLTNNQLSRLEPGWTNGLNNLKFLFLTSNRLTSLPNNIFKGLNSLLVLNLVDNGFRFANKSNTPFSDLNQLTDLDLASNNLTNTIRSNSFKNLNQLKALYLQSSNINKFSSNAFKNAFCSPNMTQTVIYISGNPIVEKNSTVLRNTRCYSFNLVD